MGGRISIKQSLSIGGGYRLLFMLAVLSAILLTSAFTEGEGTVQGEAQATPAVVPTLDESLAGHMFETQSIVTPTSEGQIPSTVTSPAIARYLNENRLPRGAQEALKSWAASHESEIEAAQTASAQVTTIGELSAQARAEAQAMSRPAFVGGNAVLSGSAVRTGIPRSPSGKFFVRKAEPDNFVRRTGPDGPVGVLSAEGPPSGTTFMIPIRLRTVGPWGHVFDCGDIAAQGYLQFTFSGDPLVETRHIHIEHNFSDLFAVLIRAPGADGVATDGDTLLALPASSGTFDYTFTAEENLDIDPGALIFLIKEHDPVRLEDILAFGPAWNTGDAVICNTILSVPGMNNGPEKQVALMFDPKYLDLMLFAGELAITDATCDTLRFHGHNGEVTWGVNSPDPDFYFHLFDINEVAPLWGPGGFEYVGLHYSGTGSGPDHYQGVPECDSPAGVVFPGPIEFTWAGDPNATPSTAPPTGEALVLFHPTMSHMSLHLDLTNIPNAREVRLLDENHDMVLHYPVEGPHFDHFFNPCEDILSVEYVSVTTAAFHEGEYPDGAWLGVPDWSGGEVEGPGSYYPGCELNWAITIDYSGSDPVTALGLTVQLPYGWTYHGIVPPPDDPLREKIISGSNEAIEFAWASIPSFPFTLNLRLLANGTSGNGQFGTRHLGYQVLYRTNSGEIDTPFNLKPFVAAPFDGATSPEGATDCPTGSDGIPLAGGDSTVTLGGVSPFFLRSGGVGDPVFKVDSFCKHHTADTVGGEVSTPPDGKITLSELLRVIQFYNAGGLHCQSGTEDGYGPGVGDTTCVPHDSDYPHNEGQNQVQQDWVISLSELLRAVQFYNVGSYYYTEGIYKGIAELEKTEDNYVPGSLTGALLDLGDLNNVPTAADLPFNLDNTTALGVECNAFDPKKDGGLTIKNDQTCLDNNLKLLVCAAGSTGLNSTSVTYKVSVKYNGANTMDVTLGTRSIDVADTTPPVIKLEGAASIRIECGTAYDGGNATATDGCGSTLPVVRTIRRSGSSNVLQSVDINTPGVYTITYTAEDTSQNSASVTRNVTVFSTPSLSDVIPNSTEFLLGTEGTFTLQSSEVANAHDPCQNAHVELKRAEQDDTHWSTSITFTCNDIGQRSIDIRAVNANHDSTTPEQITIYVESLDLNKLQLDPVDVALGDVTLTGADLATVSDSSCAGTPLLEVSRDNQPFETTVKFTCSDVGKTVTVKVRATDPSGNQPAKLVEQYLSVRSIPTFKALPSDGKPFFYFNGHLWHDGAEIPLDSLVNDHCGKTTVSFDTASVNDFITPSPGTQNSPSTKTGTLTLVADDGVTIPQPTLQVTVTRPNILFLNIDDLNDWESFLDTYPTADGNHLTPNLQDLAGVSTVFKHAYCAAPICTPSRAAIFTGRHPTNTGIYMDGDWYRGATTTSGTSMNPNPYPASNSDVLPRRLRDFAHYQIWGAGKVTHDGGTVFRDWIEWAFGDPMTGVAPEYTDWLGNSHAVDHYFRRPPEPVMYDQYEMYPLRDLQLHGPSGVYHLAVAPTRIPLDPTGQAGPPYTYNFTVHNLSRGLYGTNHVYNWAIQEVSSLAPLTFSPIPTADDGAHSLPYWVTFSGNAALQPGEDATVTVHVRDPQDLQLAITSDESADSGKGVPAATFHPIFVQLSAIKASFGAVSHGSTTRTLTVQNFGTTARHILIRSNELPSGVTPNIAPVNGDYPITLDPVANPSAAITFNSPGSRWITFANDQSASNGNLMDYQVTLRDLDNMNRPIVTVVNSYKDDGNNGKIDDNNWQEALEISDTAIVNQVNTWLDNRVAEIQGDSSVDPSVDPFYMSVGIYHPHNPLYVPQDYYDLVLGTGGSASLGLSSPGPLSPSLVTDISSPLHNATYFDTLDNVDDSSVPCWGRYISLDQWQYSLFQETRQVIPYATAYKASILYADDQFGKVWDKVKANPDLLESTVIVVWSDQGYHLGEKAHLYKGALWERTTHVPLLIHLPGQTQQSNVDTPVSLVDLYPTVMDLAGVHQPWFIYGQRGSKDGTTLIPEQTRAISLVPMLLNKSAPRVEESTITAPQIEQWFATAGGQDYQSWVFGKIDTPDSYTPNPPPASPSSLPVVTSYVLGDDAHAWACTPVFSATSDTPIHSVRDGQYRFIQYRASTPPPGDTTVYNELYKLIGDVQELTNVSTITNVPADITMALGFQHPLTPPMLPTIQSSTYANYSGGVPLSLPTVDLSSGNDGLRLQISPSSSSAGVKGVFYFNAMLAAYDCHQFSNNPNNTWYFTLVKLPLTPATTPADPLDANHVQAYNFELATIDNTGASNIDPGNSNAITLDIKFNLLTASPATVTVVTSDAELIANAASPTWSPACVAKSAGIAADVPPIAPYVYEVPSPD